MLFIFKKVNSPLCSFCKSEDETPLHLFFSCTITQKLWNQLKTVCGHKLTIPDLTSQSAIFGFFDSNIRFENLVNHLLLIFKLYLYSARESTRINIEGLKAKIVKIKEIEKNIAKVSTQKHKKFCRKWDVVKDIFN